METDRKDLKIQALLEKVSSLTTEYENRVADLRVELTIQQQEREAEVESLRHQLRAAVNAEPTNVPGEVVDVQEEE